MNVFELRNRLIADYANYVQSFFHIRDDRIRTKVEEELQAGLLWPEPLIQLNPSFEPGAWIDDLVADGILHDACRHIFRKEKSASVSGEQGKRLRLHKHQTDAIKIARDGHSYILTTGTGSGKSLAYIIPIVDHVLRHGSGRGIQAIVIYPMNALANSQEGELEKFLRHGYPDGKGPVTFARYTGQETDEQKQHIIANPPDILLTNYVMLELLLTRPQEKPLINAAKHLHFLVLDELHTYRGRQGADVAMLVRRTREAFGAAHLQLVGPMRQDPSWQAPDEQAFDTSQFHIDWEQETVTCPMGQQSQYGKPAKGPRGQPTIQLLFPKPACAACGTRNRCPRSTTGHRELTLHPPAQHLVLQAARERQQTEAFKERYQRRAGIAGTRSQAAFAFGMRRTRYRGLKKTHLQHIATATASNLQRFVDGIWEILCSTTYTSHFARLSSLW